MSDKLEDNVNTMDSDTEILTVLSCESISITQIASLDGGLPGMSCLSLSIFSVLKYPKDIIYLNSSSVSGLSHRNHGYVTCVKCGSLLAR